MTAIIRQQAKIVAAIASGAALSQAIDFRAFVMAVVHMPAVWTAASIGFYVSPTEDGTFQPLYDKNGSLVQISGPTASKSYVSPAELAGCLWIKLWSQDGSASSTNQAAARSLNVDLKS